jgi:uncharacterized protein YutE (UPF0331/DUF86 family)
MTVYFVDRMKIEKSLTYIEETMVLLENYKSFTSKMELIAMERMVHMTIEAIIDVGNAMIDGFIMRDPGSYEDIVEILCDEKVIAIENANNLKQLISLRKQLISAYDEMDHEQLKHTLHNVKASINSFPDDVRRYLTEELGPVSAFIPKKEG